MSVPSSVNSINVSLYHSGGTVTPPAPQAMSLVTSLVMTRPEAGPLASCCLASAPASAPRPLVWWPRWVWHLSWSSSGSPTSPPSSAPGSLTSSTSWGEKTNNLQRDWQYIYLKENWWAPIIELVHRQAYNFLETILKTTITIDWKFDLYISQDED